MLERSESSFVSSGNEISFHLTFDIDPNEYPGEYPHISASGKESIIDPVQILKLQSYLQEYSKKLPLGKLSYSYVEKNCFNDLLAAKRYFRIDLLITIL